MLIRIASFSAEDWIARSSGIQFLWLHVVADIFIFQRGGAFWCTFCQKAFRSSETHRTRPASASSAKMSSSVALLSAPARLHVIARRRRSTRESRGVRCAAKKKEGETSVSFSCVASETDLAVDERARGRFIRTERPFKDPPRDDATVLGDSVIPVRHPDASWFVCRTRRDGLSSTTLDGSRLNHNRHPCFLDDSETTPLQATSGSTPRTRQPR